MGYLNKICKFIRRLCTIWKLNQHTTKGKNPLSTFPKDIVHYHYYDIHIFHHSNFTISNSGCIKFRTFPLYSTLCKNQILKSQCNTKKFYQSMLKFYKKITKNNLDGNIPVRIKTKETFFQKWFKIKHYKTINNIYAYLCKSFSIIGS